MTVTIGLVATSLPAEVQAALWEPGLREAPRGAPLALGQLAPTAPLEPAAGAAAMGMGPRLALAGPGWQQSQSQSQPEQSQSQSLPRRGDDHDPDFDDDPFFAEEPAAAPTSPPTRPADSPADSPAVIEVEVPEGYTVEIELDGPTPERPRTSPIPQPVPPPVPSPVQALPPVSLQTAAPAMTTVDLFTAEPAAVVRYDPNRREWIAVCVAPCRAQVPAGSLLRVASDRDRDVAASAPYQLDGDATQVTLELRVGSRAKRAAGLGLTFLSAAGVATGMVMVDNTGRRRQGSRSSYEGYLVAGMAAVTMIAGISMAITGKTRIRERAPRRVALIPGGFAF